MRANQRHGGPTDDGPPRSSRLDHEDVAALVVAARDGRQDAWDQLVRQFSGTLWAVTRSVGLGAAEANDVCQTAWLRLYEHLDRIEQPGRVGAWLATTAKREAIRVRQRSRRLQPTDDDTTAELPAQVDPLDHRLVGDERDVVVWEAFQELPARSRRLMSLLLIDPPISYREISTTLDIPIGSIGPTRARILAKLRPLLEARGISAADVGS